jgi:DNA repair exonuclease SbcCD ATPase subunit
MKNAQNFLRQQKQELENSKKNLEVLTARLNKCKEHSRTTLSNKVKEIKERNSRLLEKTMAVEAMIEGYSLITNNFERVTNKESQALRTLSEAEGTLKVLEKKLSDSRTSLENGSFSDEPERRIEDDFKSCDPDGQKNLHSVLSKFRHGIERLGLSLTKSQEIIKSLEQKDFSGPGPNNGAHFGQSGLNNFGFQAGGYGPAGISQPYFNRFY